MSRRLFYKTQLAFAVTLISSQPLYAFDVTQNTDDGTGNGMRSTHRYLQVLRQEQCDGTSGFNFARQFINFNMCKIWRR